MLHVQMSPGKTRKAEHQGAGAHHVHAEFGIVAEGDTVRDVLVLKGTAVRFQIVDGVAEHVILVPIVLFGSQRQVREDAFHIEAGQLCHLQQFFLVRSSQTVEARIHLQMDRRLRSLGERNIRQRLGVVIIDNGLRKAAVHHVFEEPRRRVTQNKNRIVRVGGSQFDGFREGRHRQISGAVFHERGCDAHRAAAVTVGLDDGHNGHVRSNHIPDLIHIAADPSQIDRYDRIS